jgi:hypothetical protein
MNKDELKKVLKPLVKQCIREVLLEESGVLSNIVAEVANGLSTSGDLRQRVTEQEQPSSANTEVLLEEQRRKRIAARKKLADSIGQSAYGGIDLFEGTEELQSGGTVDGTSGGTMGPMANLNPNDPGVDLGSIPGLNISVAKKLLG